MFRSVLVFLILSLSQLAQADIGFISGKLGTWSFATSGISTADESASGFGAYALDSGYNFTSQLQLVAGFNVLLSDGLGGQTGFGFDLGFRFFPFTSSGSISTDVQDAQIRITEKWRPYVGGVFTERTFNFVLSTTFVGGGIRLGLDYQMSRNWFINAEFRYDMLFGPDEGKASQTNILCGAGFEF